ncbi:UNVERIFIED_CONTAM: hypothetical protein Sradi_0588000 [Sesamum radiatum]|uniref:Uncharacterized protein n=1 Tax=Sesamum radiatum TaxID=300843 RepID=A0AAW2VLD1_SESRA
MRSQYCKWSLKTNETKIPEKEKEDLILVTFKAFEAAADFPSTPLTMHVNFQNDFLRRRRRSSLLRLGLIRFLLLLLFGILGRLLSLFFLLLGRVLGFLRFLLLGLFLFLPRNN